MQVRRTGTHDECVTFAKALESAVGENTTLVQDSRPRRVSTHTPTPSSS